MSNFGIAFALWLLALGSVAVAGAAFMAVQYLGHIMDSLHTIADELTTPVGKVVGAEPGRHEPNRFDETAERHVSRLDPEVPVAPEEAPTYIHHPDDPNPGGKL